MSVALVWFRQDLRLEDNPAWKTACLNYQQVIPLYIYNQKNTILGGAQKWWLHHSLIALNDTLKKEGLSLVLAKGDPLAIILNLIKNFSVEAVHWNRIYEPKAIERDKKIKKTLQEEQKIHVQTSNGSLFHEPWVIKNKGGEFFKVFTPYWKHCKQTLQVPSLLKESPTHKLTPVKVESESLESWQLLPKLNWADGFSKMWTPGEKGASKKLNEFVEYCLKGYKKNRDYPSKKATSYLSPHLHFGEISPWTILRMMEIIKHDPDCDLSSIEHFLSELGWREFSAYLLYHFPKLSSKNFKDEFDQFPWENDKELFACWTKGQTGYPIVDAGMRELWATGYMHNRVRMIVASFLTKDLFIDWRWGADWFLDTLVDADLASNSSNWQWVAGSGADAAPYFRIFNPVLQSQKFDSEGIYIHRWVPELSGLKGQSLHAPWEAANAQAIYSKTKYPRPIVNHKESRAKALSYYHQIKQNKRR